jgi:hypothetical protein
MLTGSGPLQLLKKFKHAIAISGTASEPAPLSWASYSKARQLLRLLREKISCKERDIGVLVGDGTIAVLLCKPEDAMFIIAYQPQVFPNATIRFRHPTQVFPSDQGSAVTVRSFDVIDLAEAARTMFDQLARRGEVSCLALQDSLVDDRSPSEIERQAVLVGPRVLREYTAHYQQAAFVGKLERHGFPKGSENVVDWVEGEGQNYPNQGHLGVTAWAWIDKQLTGTNNPLAREALKHL